jgi:hypothetical protein
MNLFFLIVIQLFVLCIHSISMLFEESPQQQPSLCSKILYSVHVLSVTILLAVACCNFFKMVCMKVALDVRSKH